MDLLLKDVEEVSKKINLIREKITKDHVSGNGDCLFKGALKQYEQCVPAVKVEDLKKLLERDVEVC